MLIATAGTHERLQSELDADKRLQGQSGRHIVASDEAFSPSGLSLTSPPRFRSPNSGQRGAHPGRLRD